MWMEFLTEYGMFLAKFGTVAGLLVLIIGIILVLVMKNKAGGEEHLEIKKLNDKYEGMELMLKSVILPKKAFKKTIKDSRARHKQEEKRGAAEEEKRRIFILDFDGDIRASGVSSLRQEITALLTVAGADDEVVLTLESGGGTVHGYGLAASQLKRITDRGVKLTVAVDRVAASGGYMMACVADKIIAAPFAIIGSIGVLAQLPNFYRLLKRHDIDFEQITAGKYKRTLSLFGENKEEDREKLKEELEETHVLFKQFITENRDKVEIEKVATGEHWYGSKAIDLGLIDELSTSDAYLAHAAEEADIYELQYVCKKTWMEKLFSSTVKWLQAQS